MIEDFEYTYIGKRNTLIRYEIILSTIMLSAFSFFFAFEWIPKLSILFIILGISVIIFTLLKVDIEDNIFLFADEKLIHIKNRKRTEFSYTDISYIDFAKAPKYPNYILLQLQQRKFKFELNQKDNLDVDLNDFASFILEKNKDVLITEGPRFEKYKYFKLGDSVKKVLMK